MCGCVCACSCVRPVMDGYSFFLHKGSRKPGCEEDLNVKHIQRIVPMIDRSVEQIVNVPCGNTVILVGVDQYILRPGTITTIEDAHNITCMKYRIAPVIKVAVKPKNGKDLPKFVEGLKKLPYASAFYLAKRGSIALGLKKQHSSTCKVHIFGSN